MGLYRARLLGPLSAERLHPGVDLPDQVGTCNDYDLEPDAALAELRGRLWVEWGPGKRAWIQRADRGDKPIVELTRAFEEPAFPGFSSLVLQLSEVDALPSAWSEALRSTRGVYLLTCPKTREQYVGAALGSDGFLGRWRSYAATGHGGNVGLRSRDPSDYQVCILETVGSGASDEEILALEVLWKRKLQSREMGLNRN